MPETQTNDHSENGIFEDVSIGVRVSVGTAHPTLTELLALEADAVLPLDRSISDEVELYVNDRLLARGVLEEAGDSGQLQVRILNVGAPK